jgi:hypothetical protein
MFFKSPGIGFTFPSNGFLCAHVCFFLSVLKNMPGKQRITSLPNEGKKVEKVPGQKKAFPNGSKTNRNPFFIDTNGKKGAGQKELPKNT